MQGAGRRWDMGQGASGGGSFCCLRCRHRGLGLKKKKRVCTHPPGGFGEVVSIVAAHSLFFFHIAGGTRLFKNTYST